MEELYVGDVITLSVDIKNHLQVSVDPTDLNLDIKLPDTTIESYVFADLSHNGDGKYSLDYLIGQVGTHIFRFKGTGSNAGVGINKFVVSPDPLEV